MDYLPPLNETVDPEVDHSVSSLVHRWGPDILSQRFSKYLRLMCGAVSISCLGMICAQPVHADDRTQAFVERIFHNIADECGASLASWKIEVEKEKAQYCLETKELKKIKNEFSIPANLFLKRYLNNNTLCPTSNLPDEENNAENPSPTKVLPKEKQKLFSNIGYKLMKACQEMFEKNCGDSKIDFDLNCKYAVNDPIFIDSLIQFVDQLFSASDGVTDICIHGKNDNTCDDIHGYYSSCDHLSWYGENRQMIQCYDTFQECQQQGTSEDACENSLKECAKSINREYDTVSQIKDCVSQSAPSFEKKKNG